MVWFAAADPALAADVAAAIRDDANGAAVSVASVWELEIKRAKGTLAVPRDAGVRLNAGGSICSTSPSRMSSAPRSFPPTTATRSIACSSHRRKRRA
jgi:hypothetical protein